MRAYVMTTGVLFGLIAVALSPWAWRLMRLATRA